MASWSGENLYAILGADPSMSVDQLKACYKKLVLQYHPDKAGAESRVEMVARFQKVDQAWKTLSDPQLKHQYDSQLKAKQLCRTVVNDEIELEDMVWQEEEQCYQHSCRCGGSYSLPSHDATGTRVVQCSNCSLCVQVTVELIDGEVDREADQASLAPKR